MPRPSAVFLSPLRDLSNSSLFCTFCTVLQKSDAQPLLFQSFPASLRKRRGVLKSVFFNSSTLNSLTSAPTTPLSAALTDDLRVLPCFGRNCPPVTPLDATLTRSTSVNPLSATLTKNRVVGGERSVAWFVQAGQGGGPVSLFWEWCRLQSCVLWNESSLSGANANPEMTEIRLHNTLSGKVEAFVPLRAGEVRMYTCGPTVYDYAHIGNYRTFVFQDILRRS